MIREIMPSEINMVYKLVENDIARNYFILLSLKSEKNLYEKIYGEWDDDQLKAVLLQRKSGTLQFYTKGFFDINGFGQIISSLSYHMLISPRSYCDLLLHKGIFTSYKEGAYIAKLENIHNYSLSHDVVPLDLEDLDKVIELYKRVFNSFTSKYLIVEKLISKRGRAVCIKKNHEIISIAQTDFEADGSALIVGVATDPKCQGQGHATRCLEVLIRQLLEDNITDIYLQYDNINAGRVYNRLGFKVIDQVYHYKP